MKMVVTVRPGITTFTGKPVITDEYEDGDH